MIGMLRATNPEPERHDMETYRFATDSVSAEIDARDDDEAAREFAASEGIPDVKGMAGLLGWIAERGGYATVRDGRGDVVGEVDPDDGGFRLFPRGS
jgi:hypothetical protein